MKDKLIRLMPLAFLLAAMAIGLSIFSLVRSSTEEKPLGCGTKEHDPTTFYIPEPDSASREISSGEVLFKENCKTCHAIHTIEVGPALRGLLDRRSKKWAKQVIRNEDVLIAKKDTAVIQLQKKFGGLPHIKFTDLSDQDIEDLFLYIDSQTEVQPVIYDY